MILFKLLKKQDERVHVILSIIDNIDNAMLYLINEYNNLDDHQLIDILRVLSNIKNDKITLFSLKYINHSNAKIRHASLICLNKQAYTVTRDSFLSQIKPLATCELDYCNILIELYNHLCINPPGYIEPANFLLAREIKLSQIRIMALLSFYYGKIIDHTKSAILGNNEDKISYGIEILIKTLSPNDKFIYLPILSYQPNLSYIQLNKDPDIQEIKSCLTKMLEMKNSFHISEIYAVTIYLIGKFRFTDIQIELNNKDEMDPITLETFQWTIDKLA
jgi:hypothetical protein